MSPVVSTRALSGVMDVGGGGGCGGVSECGLIFENMFPLRERRQVTEQVPTRASF